MRPRLEQPAVKLILRDLESGPATVADLEDVTRIDRRNLRVYLRLLHEREAVHISGWEQRTGPALPVWNLGPGRDRPRPSRKYKRRGAK